MKYTNLGQTDIKVSRICLGCMGFGDPQAGMHTWTLDESASAEIIKSALEHGINFFDTAIGYQNGSSERYVGGALRRYAKRDEVVVATKFPPRNDAEIDSGETGAEHIRRMLDTSLRNLGMDYIDLYILHSWDYVTPLEETLSALNDAARAGKIREIGVSNCYAWQLQKANDIAEKNGWKKFASVQTHFNLIFREEEREMLPCCRENGVAVTPYSALAAGRLARLPGETTKRLNEDKYAKGKYDQTADADDVIIERVAEIAKKREITMTQVSLAWLLTKVTAPVAGATKVSHIQGLASVPDVELTQEEIAYLEAPYIPHKLVGVMARGI